MEGTVFNKIPAHADRGVLAPSAWALVMHQLGEEAFALESILQDEWAAQGYRQYGRFVRRTVDVMKYYGLQREQFEACMNSFDYNPGVHEAFKELRAQGIYTGMITGGFEAQASRAQRDLGIDSVSAACTMFWKPDGTIDHCNTLPWDQTEKVHFARSIMLELDARPSETAYIGDSSNDLPIMRQVGLPILINGKPEVAEEVKKMENGVIVQHWSEVPAVLAAYPRDRIY
jgi:phosphoserine phosphatase